MGFGLPAALADRPTRCLASPNPQSACTRVPGDAPAAKNRSRRGSLSAFTCRELLAGLDSGLAKPENAAPRTQSPQRRGRTGVIPKHVVHPGLLGGWRCRSHQHQGDDRMKIHANAPLGRPWSGGFSRRGARGPLASGWGAIALKERPGWWIAAQRPGASTTPHRPSGWRRSLPCGGCG
jgi:hypothetical protein